MASDAVQCCRNCRHSSQDGMTKHYRTWCLACDLADEYEAKAERQFVKLKMPASVRGPMAGWMDDGDYSGSDCKFFERKEPTDDKE